MGYELYEVVDLNRLFQDPYTFRVYINYDKESKRYKVVISGLSRDDYLRVYGTREEVVEKLKSLIRHLGYTVKELSFPSV
jgi:hypothetical protein